MFLLFLFFLKVVDQMVDTRVEKLAKLCIRYSVDLKSKEKVLIQGSELAFPLINELYKECLLADAYPLILPELDVEYTFYRYAKEHQLKFVSPFEKFIVENIDVHIYLWCPPSPKGLANIDPSKITLNKASKKEIMEIYLRRDFEGKLKWNVLPYPIKAQAQEAMISLTEYEDFVYKSCLVDKKDPITEWKEIRQHQEKICNFLNQADRIHVIGEDTDLTFNVKNRKWINCWGERNMPDGEVFTGPIEGSTNGTIRFTYPVIYSGREVEDVNLTFKDGKVVKALAAKDNEFLQQALKVDGADRIGEAAIGTNYAITKFTKNMLFDEKMGGTIHIALGASMPRSGGLNKSPIHIDMLKDMKRNSEIYADDRLFYKNGRFLI